MQLPFGARACKSLTFAVVGTLLMFPATASAQFNGIFYFGDSFTDTGNAMQLAAAAGLPNPTPSPYYPGRFSNGPVWSEIFANSLGLPDAATPAWLGSGMNYAVGGATTGLSGALGTPTGMLSQGGVFASQHPAGAGTNNLFVIFGGANDIIGAVSLSPLAQQQAIQQAVTNIGTLASGLLTNFGANQFLIPFLPDVGASPQFFGNSAGAATASALTNSFNQLLGASLMQLNSFTGVTAYGLSLNNLLTNIQIDAANGGPVYGITNTTVPCFTIPSPTACNTSLFVDGLHPTTVVHQLIADAAYNRVVLGVDVAVVPEPSTILLTALGLGAMAVMGRRRARHS